MPIDFTALQGRLSLDSQPWTAGANKAKGGLDGLIGHVNRFADTVANKMRQVAAAATGLAVASIAAGSRAVKNASDAAEQASKMAVLVGQQQERVNKQLDQFAKDAKRSRFELRSMASDFAALLGPMGLSQDAVADLSVQLTKTSTDLASFFNVADSDAMIALRAGIVGEAEPLRRLGVNLSQVRIEAEAMASGLHKGKQSSAALMTANLNLSKAGEALAVATKKYGPSSREAATAQAALARAEEAATKAMKGTKVQMDAKTKALAAMRIIERDSAAAAGDAIRTRDGYANSIRGMKGAIHDLSITLGNALMPTALATVEVFDRLFRGAEQAGDGILDWIKTNMTAENVKAFWERLFATVESLWQSASRLAGVLKNDVAPAFATVAATGKLAYQAFRKIWDTLPTGVQDVLKVAAAFATVNGALKSLTMIPFVGQFAGMFAGLVNPIGIVKQLAGVLARLTPLFLGMGKAVIVATGPIGWAVAAVAALAAAGVYFAAQSERFGPQIHRIWDKIGNVIANAWEKLKVAFGEVSELVSEAWADLEESLGDVGETLSDFFDWQKMKDAATEAFDFVLDLTEGFVDAMSGDMRRLDVIVQKIMGSMAEKIGGVLKKIPGLEEIGYAMEFVGRDMTQQAGVQKLMLDQEDAWKKTLSDAGKNELGKFLPPGQAKPAAAAAGKSPATATPADSMTEQEKLRYGTGGVLSAIGVGRGKNIVHDGRFNKHFGRRWMFGDNATLPLEGIDPATASKSDLVGASAFRSRQMDRQIGNIDLLVDGKQESLAAMKKARGLAGDVRDANMRVANAGPNERGPLLADAEDAFSKFNAFMDSLVKGGQGVLKLQTVAEEKRQAFIDAKAQRRADFLAKKTGQQAKKIDEGGDELKESLDGVADKVEESGERFQEEQATVWDQAREAVGTFTDGLMNAAKFLGLFGGQEAEIRAGLSPEEQRLMDQNKLAAKIKQAQINRGFLERGLGFGGVKSFAEQSLNLATLDRQISSWMLELTRLQNTPIGNGTGVGPDVAGAHAAAVSRGGAAAGGVLVNDSSRSETNINMTVHTKDVDPRKLLDATEAEARRRGLDATGRTAGRRAVRTPASSRIR